MDHLPTELVYMIIDFLYDDPKALRQLCLASKPFIAPTRTHLFKSVSFWGLPALQAWKKCFPDSKNAPANFTTHLGFHCAELVAGEDFFSWIWSFTKVVRLEVYTFKATPGAFAPFHDLSTHVKTLEMCWNRMESQEVFEFICSFPSLENLRVREGKYLGGAFDGSRTLPKMTGSIALDLYKGGDFIRQFLDLSDDLHFRGIAFDRDEGGEELQELVERCSGTLELIIIDADGSKSCPLPPPPRRVEDLIGSYLQSGKSTFRMRRNSKKCYSTSIQPGSWILPRCSARSRANAIRTSRRSHSVSITGRTGPSLTKRV